MAARDLVKYGYNIKSLYGGIRAYHGKLEKSRINMKSISYDY